MTEDEYADGQIVHVESGREFTIEIRARYFGDGIEFKKMLAFCLYEGGKDVWNFGPFHTELDFVVKIARHLSKGNSVKTFGLGNILEKEDFINRRIYHVKNDWLEEVERLESILIKHGIKFKDESKKIDFGEDPADWWKK